jgi:hypothetical protein
MKTPKIKFDADKIKAFFVLHCEKLVLAAIVLLVVLFVYHGYQLKGLESASTPESLRIAAQKTTDKITSKDVWNKMSQERQVSLDVVKLVERGQQPTDASLYRLPVPWSKQDFPKLVPRTDPKLYAPLHLKVVSTTGPLAYFATMSDVDPLPDTSLLASATPATPPRPAPRPRSSTRRPPGSDDGAGGGDSGRTRRSRNSRRASRDEGETVGEGLTDMGPGYGSGEMGMGGTPSINPESILGFQSADQSSIPKTATINTIMAVVPYQKQIEEFERALASSLDYLPNRDQTRYIQIGVERADVTANPQETDPAKLTWTKLSVKGSETEEARWSGYPEEVLDLNYMNFDILTHPAPPFFQRDLWESLTHPDVPLLSLATQNGQIPGDGSVTPEAELPGAGNGDLPPDIPRNPGMNTGEGGGMPGAYRDSGGESGGGARRAPPTRGGGEMGGGNTGGYGYGESGMGPVVSIPKYKLIRFNDTNVTPGKSYRYRFCVYYEDPNHPSSAFTPPSVQSLDPTVRERLKNVSPKVYWATSEWSLPSEATHIPSVESFHAGKVVQPSESAIVDDKPKVPNKEPVATVLTVVYDRLKSVDVAAEKEVQRGSTLNFIQDVEVIHPALKVVRKLEKYDFKTGAIVADMLGGETIDPLDKRNEHPLQTPGELLIFDAAGNLHVQNETDDIEDFRRYLVPKPDPMSKTGPQDLLGGEGAAGSADGGDILGGGRRRGR